MSSAGADPPISQYYDWLSRFHQFVQFIGHRGGFAPLTVHRLLESGREDVAPADVIHERILSAIGTLRSPRVVDAGCGMGGTILYLHARLGGEYDGLTLSRVQQARASREARRRGVSGVCRFHLRDYDLPLETLVPGGVDLVIAIESLAHSKDPRRTIANLSAALRSGGRLLIVDDVPRDVIATDDVDFAAFKTGWACERIATETALTTAMEHAGLTIERDEDLTPLVKKRDPAELERLIKSNRRWRSVIGANRAGALVDSLHGGLMLERLYHRSLVRYRLIAARRR